MPLDQRISASILEATESAGQDRSLGKKIIAWFEALNSGNESMQDRESVARHMELFYALTREEQVIEGDEGEEE